MSFLGNVVNASSSAPMLVSPNSSQTVYPTPEGTDATSQTQASSIQSSNIVHPSPSFLSRSSTFLIGSANETGSQTNNMSSPGTTPSLITSMSAYYAAVNNSSFIVDGSPSPSNAITPSSSSFVQDVANSTYFTSQVPNVQSHHSAFSTSVPEISSATAHDHITRNRTVYVSSHLTPSQSLKSSSFSHSAFSALPSSDSALQPMFSSSLSVSQSSPTPDTPSLSSISFSSLGKFPPSTGQPLKSESSDQSMAIIPNSLPGSVTVTVNNSSASSKMPTLNTSSRSLEPSLATSAVPPHPTLPAAGIRYVNMKITIDMPFEVEYYDRKSLRYRNLVEKLSAQLIVVFKSVPGFVGIRILIFQNGSVICSYLVLLARDSRVENGKLKEVLEKAIKGGNLTFKVKSVEVDEGEEPEEKLFKWALIAIIVLGCLTFVLLVVLIIICVST